MDQHSGLVGVDQRHRLERVVPTNVPAGVRSRGFVAAMFCPSGCGAQLFLIYGSGVDQSTIGHDPGCQLMLNDPSPKCVEWDGMINFAHSFAHLGVMLRE